MNMGETMTTIVNTSLKMPILGGILLISSIGFLSSPMPAFASGSIGAGGGGISNFGQIYRQGKKLFFHKIACSKAHCPIKRSEVNANRAASLVNSLEARDELKDLEEETRDDQIIKLLCPGDEAAGCLVNLDEQEMVRYYLTRRFKLNKN